MNQKYSTPQNRDKLSHALLINCSEALDYRSTRRMSPSKHPCRPFLPQLWRTETRKLPNRKFDIVVGFQDCVDALRPPERRRKGREMFSYAVILSEWSSGFDNTGQINQNEFCADTHDVLSSRTTDNSAILRLLRDRPPG